MGAVVTIIRQDSQPTVQIVRNEPPAVNVIQRVSIVQLKTNSPFSSSGGTPFDSQPFTVTAIQDQVAIPLPEDYKTNGMLVLAINGSMQNQAGGDFVVSGTHGNYIATLSEPLDAGDIVYGIAEVS